MLLWLMPMMTWNILALNLSLSAYLVIGAILEERKLVQQFGAAYEAYRSRTPFLIPFMKRSQ
jgi:protein-S-isoprenylcysteine O-methyltransferase Ste14